MENTIDLYHGTCLENAKQLLKNGWYPNKVSSGSNLGKPNYLYLSSEPEDALWFAEEKGCDIVLKVSNVPIDFINSDPEDEAGYTKEELIDRIKTLKFPSKFILTKPLSKEYFQLYKSNIIQENNNPEIINEIYPSSFNFLEFKNIRSFAGKLKYANERLQKIASGSARVVYKVDEEKVLKIAKNKKGLAQNQVESEGYIQNYGVVAKVFETDDDNFYVEMELAKKLTPTRFKQLAGFSIEDLDKYLKYLAYTHKPTFRIMTYWKQSEEFVNKMESEENEFLHDLVSLIMDYDMPYPGDFDRLSTYGEVLREGDPTVVLIDFGLTQSVHDDFYKVK